MRFCVKNRLKTNLGEAEKKGVVSRQLYADYAVLDGDLTLTLPPKVSKGIIP